MTFEDATAALLQHFNTQWTASYPAIPVQYPNTEPVSANTETGSFVTFAVVPTFAQRIANGGLLRRMGGRVLVGIYEPRANGDGLSATYRAFVTALWDTAHDDGLNGAIHLGAPESIPGGDDSSLPMWRSGISIPFVIDHSP